MTTPRNYYGDPKIFIMAASESSTHTNTTDEATIATLTLPANADIRPGSVLRIKAVSEADSANSTDTHKVNLKIGNSGGTFVALATGEALDVASGNVHISTADLIFEAIGSACTVKGAGHAIWSTSGAAQTYTAVSDTTNLSTLSDLLIEVSVDHSVASASNQTSVKLFYAELIPPVV